METVRAGTSLESYGLSLGRRRTSSGVRLLLPCSRTSETSSRRLLTGGSLPPAGGCRSTRKRQLGRVRTTRLRRFAEPSEQRALCRSSGERKAKDGRLTWHRGDSDPRRL